MSDKSDLVLVSGGAGFIGSHLVRNLLNKGYRVRVLDNLSTGKLENLSDVLSHIEFIQADAADFDYCVQSVSGARFVLHQAAIPSVPRSVKEPLISHQSGPTATLNLLEAARLSGTVERFLLRRPVPPMATPSSCPNMKPCCPTP